MLASLNETATRLLPTSTHSISPIIEPSAEAASSLSSSISVAGIEVYNLYMTHICLQENMAVQLVRIIDSVLNSC